MQETWVQPPCQEDPLEEEIRTHSSIFIWETPWKEDLSGLQSMGLQRAGPEWATEHLFHFWNGMNSVHFAILYAVIGKWDFSNQ